MSLFIELLHLTPLLLISSVLCTYIASNILHTQFILFNLSYEKQVARVDIDIKFYNSGTTKHNGISTVEQG